MGTNNVNFFDSPTPYKWVNAMPPIFTFFSYKGGIGRSTTIAFVAKMLADAGKRIFVLDANLEAPGIHTLFTIEHPNRGFVDVLNTCKAEKKQQLDLSEYVLQADPQIDPEQRICVMPVGNLFDPDYLEKLAELEDTYWGSSADTALGYLLTQIHQSYQPDIILIDSPTGWTSLAGALLFGYSTHAVVMVTPYHTEYGINLLSEPIRKVGEQVDVHFLPTFLDRDSYYRDLQIDSICGWLHASLPVADGRESQEIRQELEQERKRMLSEIGIKRSADLAEVRWKDLGDSILRRYFSPLVQSILHNLTSPTELAVDKSYNIFLELDLFDMNNVGYAENLSQIGDVRKYFVMPPETQRLLDSKKIIITGRKGSGKSFLFTTLHRYKEYYDNPLDQYQDGSLIGYDAKDVKIEDTVWIGLRNLQREYQHDIPLGLFWKSVWYSHLLAHLQATGIELEGAPDMKATWANQSEDMVKNLTPYVTDISKILLLERMLTAAQDQYQQQNQRQLVLYDNLETIGGNDSELRKEIIQSLVKMWFDLRDRGIVNLIPKLFIRTDIFERLSMTNLGHRSPYVMNIEWDLKTLWRLMLKMLISSSETLREELLRQWEKYESKEKTKPSLWTGSESEKLGIELTTSEEAIHFMVNTIFFERYSSKKDASPGTLKGSPKMYHWFENRLRDGQGTVYPREWMQLVAGLYHTLRGQSDVERVFESYHGIFPVVAIQGKNAVFVQVSSTKWQGFKDEFQEYEQSISLLKEFIEERIKNGNRTKTFLDSELFAYISAKNTSVEIDCGKMVNIGLLENTAKPREYRIPEIYQFALGLRKE